MPLDESVLMIFQSLRIPALTGVFLFLTEFGAETIQLPLIAFLYWCGKKRIAILIGISFFSGMVVNQLLKITFCVQRPFLRFENLAAVAEALPGASGFSFPSGHTAGAISVYGMIAMLTEKRWLKIVMVSLIAAVGISRLYLGVHTPTDVLAAIVIGTLILIAVRIASRSLAANPALKNRFLLLGFALLLISMLYALLKPYPEGTGAFLRSDVMKTVGAALGGLIGFRVEESKLRFEAPKSWLGKILVFIPGIALTMALRVLLKAPLNTAFGELVGSFVRYVLITFWITALYPVLFDWALRRAKRTAPVA